MKYIDAYKTLRKPLSTMAIKDHRKTSKHSTGIEVDDVASAIMHGIYWQVSGNMELWSRVYQQLRYDGQIDYDAIAREFNIVFK